MLERQFKNAPSEISKNISKNNQEKMIAMITKNPELFQKIALEVKTKTDGGADQMKATMEVMKKYENQLVELQRGK